MARRKTHEEYVAEVEALGTSIKVVGKYQRSTEKITHRCAAGHEWEARAAHIVAGHGCPKCSGHLVSHEEYVESIKHRGFTVVGKYQGANKKITHRCANGHEWDAQPTSVKNGKGCPHCSGHIVTHADYVESIRGRGITVIGTYQSSDTKITHRCAEGHEWDAKPTAIRHSKQGCPHCAEKHTDANVFYIWENADDPGVYKVGITSERCAGKRVSQCARDNKMTANVILMVSVQDARDIERRALKIGDSVNYPDTIDGYTEFRRYSDEELGQVWRMAVAA